MRLRICLTETTGRSYGAKYLDSRFMLQTGRPAGAEEKIVTLYGNSEFARYCLPERLKFIGRNGYSEFPQFGLQTRTRRKMWQAPVPRWRGIKGVEWHAWEFRQAFLLFAVMNK